MEPKPEPPPNSTNTDSNITQPQDNNLVPTRQIGHMPEVIPTPYVPMRTRAENQLTCKQIEKDYSLLEDILNPILVDITLSGKYPDTSVNIDELASVEVLLEFKQPKKQLVGTKDHITLTHGVMPKQQQFIKIIRRLATSAIKQYNLPVMLHNLAVAYTKSPGFLAIYKYIRDDKVSKSKRKQ